MATAHSDDRTSIQELLSDARLVFDYGIRVGRFADESLVSAIESTEAAIEANRRPEPRALAAALSEGIKAISPVTLLDLRAGKSPFDPRYQRKLKSRQYRLVALTLVLATLIAFYSIALHKEENALIDLQQVQNSRITEKVASLRKLVQHEKAFSAQDSRYDQYRLLVTELRDLDARRISAYKRVYALAEESEWSLGAQVFDSARRLFAVTTTPSNVEAGAKAPAVDDSTVSVTQSPYGDDVCAKLEPQRPERLVPQESGWFTGLSSEELSEYCFLQKLAIVGSGIGTYASPVEAVNIVRDKILLQSAWILPFLSGLLGAAVFLLRDALDPKTAAIGSSLSMVRLAMGGIAGIIIGWFWAPTGAATSGVGVVSSVPFGLAFVTGFSIEILFSALDRVNRSILDETSRARKEPREH